MKIGIVGLGLIGGSFAKTIKKHTAHTVSGLDTNPTVIKRALKENAIDVELSLDTLSKCQLLFLSLYPKDTIGFLEENAGRFSKDTIIIDFCGVKEIVCDFAKEIFNETDSPLFIGGHPMAGKEVSGFSYASDSLFDNASMILTPEDTVSTEILAKLENFFLTLGFGAVTLSTPKEHDKIIAYTSQMAHVVSNAYIQSPTAQQYSGFSAGSFKDLTRVAYLNEAMWSELFMYNKEALVSEINVLLSNIKEIRNLIQDEDRDNLLKKLKIGKEIKAELNKTERGFHD